MCIRDRSDPVDPVALSESALEQAQCLREPAGLRQLPLWSQRVDGGRQALGELGAGRLRRKAGLLRDLLKVGLPKPLLDLGRRDRQIGTRAHPRSDDVAQPLGLEGLDQTRQAAARASLAEHLRQTGKAVSYT